jgi:transposase
VFSISRQGVHRHAVSADRCGDGALNNLDKDPVFKILPRRWVVERTFGWMMLRRRLVRDRVRRLYVSKAMIRLATGPTSAAGSRSDQFSNRLSVRVQVQTCRTTLYEEDVVFCERVAME